MPFPTMSYERKRQLKRSSPVRQLIDAYGELTDTYDDFRRTLRHKRMQAKVPKRPFIDPRKNHTGPFRLTDLPLEILLIIFDSFPSRKLFPRFLSADWSPSICYPDLHSLLLVNKAISAAAALVLYLPRRVPERVWFPYTANWSIPTRRSLTHIAATEGYLNSMMNLHLITHLNLDCTDDLGLTPLHRAAQSGHIEIVKFLLAHCSETEPKTGPNNPLAMTLGKKVWGIPHHTPEYVGIVPLHLAARGGHTEVVAALLAGGADIRVGAERVNYPPVTCTYRGPYMNTYSTCCSWPPQLRALLIAAAVGATEVVGILLEHSSPDEEDLDGALLLAAAGGFVETVKLLLAYKPDGYTGSAMHACGLSLLHVAARAGSDDIVELLVRKGANMEAKDRYNHTPLHDASVSGNVSVVRVLVENGANTYDLQKSRWIAMEVLNRRWVNEEDKELLELLWTKIPRERKREWWEHELYLEDDAKGVANNGNCVCG
ncbi:ankyrin [Wilcoxina mikolae CBS 423.85]|nr:ankyrin [Wilcoxina mikolae CBS 423.85]